MVGTILNVAGIVIGGAVGLARKDQPSAANQSLFKIGLGLFATFVGLRLTWISLSGPLLQVLKQLLIVLLAMMIGKLAGRLLRLQKWSNRAGDYARQRMAATRPGTPRRWSEGFNACAVLFCAAPLAVLGPITEGLSGYYAPLAIKAVMDGLATMAFVTFFGWSAAAAALPVFVYQGTITLAARGAQPWLIERGLVDPINATAGLLIFSIALVIFEVKKIELTDYLPSLIFAPVLAWLWW